MDISYCVIEILAGEVYKHNIEAPIYISAPVIPSSGLTSDLQSDPGHRLGATSQAVLR